MHNTSMLFATVSWQQTILWGSWSASDSRGIISLSLSLSLSGKWNSVTNWASSFVSFHILYHVHQRKTI